MWFYTCLFLIRIIIFSFQNDRVMTNPMTGNKITFPRQGEFPAVVSIKAMDDSNEEQERNHICTGTLISKRDVITAAHCEDDMTGFISQVVVGSTDVRQGQTYNVTWWITFNDWCLIANRVHEYDEDDIAIIRLNRDVSDAIPPAKLGTHPNYNYYGKKVAAVAFGSMGEHATYRYMHSAPLTVLDNERCEHRIEVLRQSRFVVPNYFICAIAQPYVIMTPGNSGCPIFYNNKLIGIHKGICPTTQDVTNDRKINIFLSTFYFQQYIEDVIQNF